MKRKFNIYELTQPESVEQLVRRLFNEPAVAVDTETEEIIDGWSPIGKAKMFSIQFGVGSDTWFIPTWGKYRIFLDIIKPYLEEERRSKLYHNAIFDYHVMANHGINPAGLLCDTLAAEYTWYNDNWYPEQDLANRKFPAHRVKVSRQLKSLCSMYFNEDLPDYKEVFTDFTAKKRGGRTINKKGSLVQRNAVLQNLIDYERTIGGHERIVEYAAKDPFLTFMLYEHVRKRLEADPWLAKSRKGCSMWDYFAEIEVPFTEALFSIERAGLPLDWEALENLDSAFAEDEHRLRNEWNQACINAGAKREYSISSPQDVAVALTDLFGEKLIARGKTKADGSEGNFTVDKNVLMKLSAPVAKIILDWREVSKAKGTYTETLRESYNRFDGMAYTHLNQTGTRTGRISSNNINLLNIPAKTKSGKATRACFCAKPDEDMGCADWDQAELRETSYFSKEPVLINLIAGGWNQHAVTTGDIDPEVRNWRAGRASKEIYDEIKKLFPAAYTRGKTFNFGVIYGMGGKKYAASAGIPEDAGYKAVRAYWDARPYLKAYQERQANHAEQHGYILDILSVPIWIGEAGSLDPERVSRAARKAGNSGIQGSIAKRAKIAMIAFNRNSDLKRDNVKCCLNVYDEFLFRAPKGALQKHKATIEDILTHPLKQLGINAPEWAIPAELGIARNWRDAKEAG